MIHIVERLRIWRPPEVEEAARVLDAAAEIERLRQSRLPDEVVDIKVVIELRAENERLRVALREILERTSDPVIQAIGMDALGE